MIKNLIKSVLSYIIFLPIVGSLFLLDIQNIFNFNQIFWYILAVYLVFSILVLIFYKFRQKENFWYFAKFSIVFIIALLPGLLLGYFYGESIENNIILRITGRVAFLYLALALIISPIISLLKGKYSEQLVLIRKIFGIQAFLFFLLHGLNYIEIERYYYYGDVSFLVYFLENLKNRYDAISGIVAGVVMLLLGVTSNKFSQRVLGKIWKGLHYLVYPLFLLTMLHIAFAGRFDEFYAIILIVVVSLRFIVFLKDFNKQTTQNTNKKTTKYICVVCGYIYDEKKGDPDGGLPPGTKFEDIPEDWVCPVCGVTKKDFEPYYEDEESENTNIATIQNISYLTKDVVKFVIKTSEKLNYTPGQFVKIGFEDFDGKFVRQYSIAQNDENSYTFLIKLNPYGRAGKLIPKLGEGNKVIIEGFFGEFKLQNTDNKKVFIATGTGLAPIYNMLINTPSQTEKELYFCVEKYEDLFFQNKLEIIENLKINYHLSKENIKGFNYGRIDLSNISFDENTEFYICGNPNMVSEKVNHLQEKGYKNIYYEKFL